MRFATSYFGNRILRHVETDMQRLRREGFDIVVHTFSENDFEFWERTIRKIASISKDTGLEVWLDPWGIGGVFGGEAYSRKALTETSWLQVSAANQRLPACCPNNPSFRRFIQGWIAAACATEADAIFWDEPHFYADESGLQLGCYCEHCRRTSDEEGVSGFLKWVFSETRERGKQSVLCLLPDHVQCYGRPAVQSFVDAGLGNLGTDPFWSSRGEKPEDCVTRFGSFVTSAARDSRIQSHIWIQGFRIPSGREWEITQAVTAAGRLTPDVIAIWGFEGCAAMSSIACERPEAAWSAFLKGVEMARAGQH